jgi:hypothetical protein
MTGGGRWGAAALAASLVYATAAVAGMAYLNIAAVPLRERALVFFDMLTWTAPLGLLALALGMFCHWTGRGGRWAVPGIAVALYTPGGAALLYATGELTQARLSQDLAMFVMLAVLLNVAIAWPAMRVLGRIGAKE